MSPDEMFAQLLLDDLPYHLAERAPVVQGVARAVWPSEDHPENIWTRNRSVEQFTTAVGPTSITVTNEADYSGYTDGGFTFRGPRTALPWAQRGGAPYLEQTAEIVAPEEASALIAHAAREV